DDVAEDLGGHIVDVCLNHQERFIVNTGLLDLANQETQGIGKTVRIPRAGAVTAGSDFHRRNGLKTIADGGDDRRAGRRNEFAFNVTSINWLSFQKLCDGGRRNRKTSMGHFGHAEADAQRRGNELFDSEQVESYGRAADVDDGVDCADFMKVDFLNRLVVDMTLCFSQP